MLVGIGVLAACSQGVPDYDATGTFETTEVLVSSEASGRLLALDVEEGDSVREFQTIGLIDTIQLSLKRNQLMASMKAVEVQRPDLAKQIAALQQRLATAQKEKQRVENLLKAGATNQKQLDDWEAQVALLRKEITAQQSSLQNSHASLSEQGAALAVQIAQVEDQLAKCRAISPISGTILAKYAQAGELATVGKPLFKVADMKQMYLRAYVTSGQLSELKLGDSITVYADYGDTHQKPYPGVITWIADRAEFTPKTILTKDERADLVYALKIAVKNDGYLKIGLYGGVTFTKK